MNRPQLATFIRGYIGETLPYLKVTHDSFAHLKAQFEKCLVEDALRRVYGNQVKASRLLRMNRNTLRKIIIRHGINTNDFIQERPAGYSKEVYQRDPTTGLYL